MTLEDVFSKVLGTPVTELRDDTSPQTLRAWSSLRHVELVTALEQHFGVKFSMGEILSMQSLGRVRELLKKKGKLA